MSRVKRDLVRKLQQNLALVLSDLDGTLLRPDNRIDPEDRRAIAQLQARGTDFGIASGRPLAMFRIYLEELDVQGPVISCNGALVYEAGKSEPSYRRPMDAAEARACLDFLQRRDIDYLIYDEDCIYYPSHSKKIQAYHRYNALAHSRGSQLAQVRPLEATSRLQTEHIYKIYVHDPSLLSLPELRDFLRTETSLVGASSRYDNLDIAPAGTSKASAAAWILARRGLDARNLVFFGDSENDLELMNFAAYPIAMGNATEACRQQAWACSASNRRAGLAAFLRQYVLV